MKRINFFIVIFYFLTFCVILKAENNISLKEYLIKKNIKESSTQIYLLNRCSAVYVYASAIILKSDPVNSKKFIEIANNLLFKSVELKIIDKKEKLENAKKIAEEERENIFRNYSIDGKKNWIKNKSYFKGSYISEDISICDKLINNK
jgi:predicted membrane protein|tara:strand:- start:1024 stop:1467 length:444 start_codon:yes stop_codon:yes gene_type:complete